MLDDEAIDFLVMLVEANVTITINELNRSLQETFPRKPRVCNMTISRALDGELLTLKMVRNVPVNRNSEAVKDARVTFAQYMYETGNPLHRVYIDETGYNLYTARSYGRAVRGQRVNRIVAGQRGNNVTLIAAISPQAGLFYREFHFGSVTKPVFKNFMTSLDAVLGPQAALLLMDNAPCHAGIEAEIEGREIKRIPPNSPFLNPIEECFSVLKSYLKRSLNDIVRRCDVTSARNAGVTLKQYRETLLRQKMEEAIPSVDAVLCRRNYAHAQTYLRKCLAREDIWD